MERVHNSTSTNMLALTVGRFPKHACVLNNFSTRVTMNEARQLFVCGSLLVKTALSVKNLVDLLNGQRALQLLAVQQLLLDLGEGLHQDNV